MSGRTRHTAPFTGFDLERDVPMSRHTSLRIGGPAEYLARPRTCEELTGLFRAASAAGIRVTVLGAGTNTLVTDAGIRGLVVLLTGLTDGPAVLDPVTDSSDIRNRQASGRTVLRARAGVSLPRLCRFALENGLSGLEWAAGIPGTLGGAVRMNAGSFGSDMSAVTAKVDVLDTDTLAVRTVDAADLKFSYRHLELDRQVILRADLQLLKGNQATIEAAYDRNLAAKKNSQPVSRASAGCFFKNPSPDEPAGRLIDAAGLKGERIGGAMVSDLHANFIINQGKATCKDILALKERIVTAVNDTFNITLETEVEIIGD